MIILKKIKINKITPEITKIILLIIVLLGLYVIYSVSFNNVYLIYLVISLFAFLVATTIFVVAKKWLLNRNQSFCDSSLWILIAIFGVLFSIISINRHNQYLSHAYDLGLFSQVIYNYAHSGFGDSSIRGFANIFGDHFSPILALFSPFYWLIADPKVLLVCQALMVSFAIWPLYQIAKNKIGHVSAILISIGYLLFCGVGFTIRFDFHEIAFFPTLFLFAYYFFSEKKYFYYFIFIILCLLVKENIAIYLAFFSIYLFFKNKTIALATILLSIGYYLLATKVIIPHYSQGNFGYFLFSSIGTNEIDAIKNIFSHPSLIYSVATDNLQKIDTVLAIFGSFGFLIVFCPIFILLVLPMLAEQVLYDVPTHWSLIYHYSIAIAPFIALGTICAIVKIANFNIFKTQKISKNEIYIFLSIFVLCSSMLITVSQKSPLISFFTPSFYREHTWTRDIDQLINIIPSDASVGAQDNIVPHLSERKYITPYPLVRDNRMNEPEYYIFSTQGSYFPLITQCDEIRQIASIFAKQGYGLYQRSADAYLFKKNYYNDVSQKEGLDHLRKTDPTCIIDQ